jgi:hypothetical protein
MNRLLGIRWKFSARLLFGTLLVLLIAFPTLARTSVDFDPNLDCSKYKTSAFIGGVENLVRLQLNPDLLNDRVHRAVTRELTRKGLREVKPNENPNLVVRYWADSSQQINVSTMGNWGPYGPYIGSYWGWMFIHVSATSTREGSSVIDLIDPISKDLTGTSI